MVTFKKGSMVTAYNKRTREVFSFKCPRNGMCNATLRRYCVVELEKGVATDEFIFTKE